MTNHPTGTTAIDPTAVSVRVKIAGLWTSLLFIFAYVDIFGFFRADVLNDALAGKVHIFEASQTFLLLTTLYVTIPSLMIFLSLVLKPKINIWANIVVAAVYLVTIAGSMVGETWIYFLFGSVIEAILLCIIIWYAWHGRRGG